MADSIDRLRARSRDLERNTPLGAAHALILTDYVVGTGLRPTPAALTAEDQPYTALNKRLRELWSQMEDVFDTRRQGSVYDLMVTAVRTVANAGAALVHMPLVTGNPDLAVPLQLEGLEPDFLGPDGTERSTGNEICNGVELDRATGAPVAFHIQVEKLGSLTGATRRVPAEEMVCMFNLERWGQVIGVPDYTPVIGAIHDQDEYAESELIRADANARINHWIKTAHGKSRIEQLGELDETDTESPQDYTQEIPKGLVNFLFPDEDIVETGAHIPPANFDAFMRTGGRRVGSGIGTSYELLTGDHSDTHFSASRAIFVRDGKRLKKRQADLMWQLCRRLWWRFLDVAVMSRAVAIDSRLYFGDLAARHRLRRVSWLPAGVPYPEPHRDIPATIAAIAAGFATRSEACIQRGTTFEVVTDQLREEESIMRAKGIRGISTPGDLARMLWEIEQDAEPEGDRGPRTGPNGRNGRSRQGVELCR